MQGQCGKVHAWPGQQRTVEAPETNDPLSIAPPFKNVLRVNDNFSQYKSRIRNYGSCNKTIIDSNTSLSKC